MPRHLLATNFKARGGNVVVDAAASMLARGVLWHRLYIQKSFLSHASNALAVWRPALL